MTQRQEKKQTGPRPFKLTNWKQSKGVRLALLLLFVLLFYFSMAPHLVPKTYNVELGGTADRDIRAPKEWADEKATIQAQEEASERVETVYNIVALRNENLIDQIFARMDQINQDAQVTQQNKVDIYRTEIPRRYTQFVDDFVRANRVQDTYNKGLLEEMAETVKEQQYTIPEETFYKLPRMDSDQLEDMRVVAREIVRELMNDQLREAETARTKVAELVNASSLPDRTQREIVQELARYAIMPNKFADTQATEEARRLAKENTPKVVIGEGDIVVREGERITQDAYDKLQALGLLDSKKSYWPQLGVLLLSGLFMLVVYQFMLYSAGVSNHPKRTQYTNAQLLMLLLIFVLNVGLMQIIGLIQTQTDAYIGLLAPAAMGTILITLLLDVHLAMISSILFAMLGSILFNTHQGEIFDFHFGFVIIVVSFAAIFSIHRASQRSTILKAGIMISLFGSAAALAVLMIGQPFDRTELLYSIGFAFASGLLTAVLVIGLMPFFEVTFGILSALKLVELSNPNHPLLRKLLTETPGTYHHSVMVGNLSEAAAEAIGADGLLCRVGSYYHDIGKTKRPSYFIENQSNIENPHDSIEPELSKSIIIAHARDGVEMLKSHNIPKPLRDIAEQHHGTTFLKYFYHKALKLAEADGVEPDFTEDDFRYPGPKAQSKEAAIVGIADCIEAAVRSLRNPTVEQVESMIHKIIKGRLEDNQFNECDLTMKELDKIAETLKESVIGIFHSRIEYPEDVKPSATKERPA
ncbi:HDIG domain-containing protein [Paenibacillus sp. IB182496]|uniref:HDIG domain-containing protein n=1 Tax=Paenibacillus sabuli TaxID=2772509 RepID=A0A927BS10_9BACL|nr:HDIG domain-containing metalloprotein [Paenibacillus sabuli]MBD2844449.1 HDIG domain-containing protein [Paenibacillus sabuli]